MFLGFPGGSTGKESTCDAGDLGSIPGLVRSPEKGKATHSSILAWRNPWIVQSTWGYKESDMATIISLSLPLGRKAMTNLVIILKSRDIALPTKVCIVKSMILPVHMCTHVRAGP